MSRAFLWIIIAILAGAAVWLFVWAERGGKPAQVADTAEYSRIYAWPYGPVTDGLIPHESASEEQLKLRKAVLSGSYEQPAAREGGDGLALDVLYLENGRRLEGEIVSQDSENVSFRAAGSSRVGRIPRKEILKIASERSAAQAAVSKSGGSSRISSGGSEAEDEDEKPEEMMTAEEWQEHQARKNTERLERSRKQGGVRAIGIAREIRENAEKRDEALGTKKTRKEVE